MRTHRASRGATGLRMKDMSVFTERGSVTVPSDKLVIY